MKTTRSEFGHEYQTYRFGYCEYADVEKTDNLAEIYGSGFLPFSADPSIYGRFYMARSARILLPRFACSSENRRIAKRFDGLFSKSVLSPSETKKDQRVRTLFLDYFLKRHGKEVMPPSRFDAILKTPLPIRFVTYTKEGQLAAAALEVSAATFGHFWFSAYDVSYAYQSLGMWLMLDAVREAQRSGRTHFYLGTVYGEKALYKTNLEPLEFWNGSAWDTDLARLKKVARSEPKRA